MFDTSAVVNCGSELEAVVGSRPRAIMLKSIRFLDGHCEQFLACSPFLIVATRARDGSLHTVARGGEPGLVSLRSVTTLVLGDMFGSDVVDGAPTGLIALVPGYGETLRINGRLRVVDGVSTLEVEEALLHCAKAVLRSELWTRQGRPEHLDGAATPTIEAFLAAAPFAVLASTDGDGHADVSPRGDPPGLIRHVGDNTFAIADRPGNRRTDTLHNLMDNPRIALLALQPGANHVAELRGTARVSVDPALLDSLRLRSRTPKTALLVDVDHGELRQEPALLAADLWNPTRFIADGALPPAATIWADHVRRNNDPGGGAAVARRLVNTTALAAGVAVDYRVNL